MPFLLFALSGEATLAECRLRTSGVFATFGVYAKVIERRVIDDSV